MEDGRDDKQQDDSVSLADTVMSSAQSIRSVHSKRSLAALIDRQKAKRQVCRGAPRNCVNLRLGVTCVLFSKAESQLEGINEEGSVGVPSPRVAVVDEENGARLKNKTAVSRLPYMNRNPAV